MVVATAVKIAPETSLVALKTMVFIDSSSLLLRSVGMTLLLAFNFSLLV